MIGILCGKILFSDGYEAILQTKSGIGYQMFCKKILPEGESASLYISHIIREAGESLYAFNNLIEKKLFELLTTVKGVGPKSAYNVISDLNVSEIIRAIETDDSKVLTRVSGIGAKAASQMILDLKKKVAKIRMYSDDELQITLIEDHFDGGASDFVEELVVKKAKKKLSGEPSRAQKILDDTLLACENLGFSKEKIVPLAQKILKDNKINKPEQLVHLVLKEV